MDGPVTEVLRILEAEREQLKIRYERLSSVAETARCACVPVQQRLSKLEDAIQDLEHALQWKPEGGA